MKIDVFGIHEQRDIIEVESPAGDLELKVEDFIFDDPVKVTCKLARDGEIVRLNCRTKATVITPCVRCLQEFRCETTGEFKVVAQRLKEGEIPPEYRAGEEEREEEDHLIIVPGDQRSIDISEEVHDAVILSLPLKPVCRDTCKGLCYICGQNMNEKDCGCRRESIDPRWSALSELKKDATDSKTEVEKEKTVRNKEQKNAGSKKKNI